MTLKELENQILALPPTEKAADYSEPNQKYQ
jgi:hypothetical protein